MAWVIYIACGSALSGILCMRLAQRDSCPAFIWLAAGLGLIAGSIGLWIEALGAEFGTVIGLFWLAIAGWLAVLWNSEKKSVHRSKVSHRNDSWDPALEGINKRNRLGFKQSLKQLGYFTALVPLFAISSTLTTLTICYLLPLPEIDQLAIAIILLPVIWGAAAFWLFADNRPARPILFSVALAFFSATFLFS